MHNLFAHRVIDISCDICCRVVALVTFSLMITSVQLGMVCKDLMPSVFLYNKYFYSGFQIVDSVLVFKIIFV